MSFTDDLAGIGFELVQRTRAGAHRFARRSNPYLQWWVVEHPDGTAEITWELELGAYLNAKGFHISVQDELSLLLFPPGEVRGAADAAWVSQEIEATEGLLGSIDLSGAG